QPRDDSIAPVGRVVADTAVTPGVPPASPTVAHPRQSAARTLTNTGPGREGGRTGTLRAGGTTAHPASAARTVRHGPPRPVRTRRPGVAQSVTIRVGGESVPGDP